MPHSYAQYPKPVALVGRVPVRVSTINGDIEPGDSLALSEIPGVLMKATKAGVVIGRAMEGFDGTTKKSQKTQELIDYMEGGKSDKRQIEKTREKLQKAIDALNRDFSADEGLILMYVNIGWQGNDLSVQEDEGQLVNLTTAELKSGLSSIGLIVNETGVLQVDTVISRKAQVHRLELVDQITGEIYCTWLENGDWKKSKIACDSLDLTNGNNTQSSNPTPEEIAADETAPVITLLGVNPAEVEENGTYVDAGATAIDDIDGDITSSIVTVNYVDTSTLGEYSVTYNISDAAGNAGLQVVRTVNVVELISTPTPDPVPEEVVEDTTIPVITLLGETTISIEVGDIYTDEGATAVDETDGDITSGIVVVNLVDGDIEGSYTVTYNVSDTAGNSAAEGTRTVNVTAPQPLADTIVPVITLVGEATVTLEVGATYIDEGATATDDIDGDITATIVIDNLVDATTLGTYTVTYNVSDATGNAAISVVRTVEVTESTP